MKSRRPEVELESSAPSCMNGCEKVRKSLVTVFAVSRARVAVFTAVAPAEPRALIVPREPVGHRGNLREEDKHGCEKGLSQTKSATVTVRFTVA